MSDYQIAWTRLGRGTPPPAQIIRNFDPEPSYSRMNRLAEAIFGLARPRLISRDVDVSVVGDPETTPIVEIFVSAGFQTVGIGELRKL